MAYTGPDFVNGGPPAINAANLNGMVSELERCSARGDEVEDIRTGADGTVYQSAGDSVRNQIGNLKSALNHYENILVVKNLADVASRTAQKRYGSAGGKVLVVDADQKYIILPPIRLMKNHKYHLFLLTYGANFIFFRGLDGETSLGNLTTYTTATVNRNGYNDVEVTPDADCDLCITIAPTNVGLHIMVTEDFMPMGYYAYNVPICKTVDGKLIDEFVDVVNYDTFVFSGVNNFFTYINSITRQDLHTVKATFGEGTYNVTAEIEIADHVIVAGLGADKTIIDYNPSDTSAESIKQHSLFLMQKSGGFEDVKLVAINARYVVHHESANHYKNWKVVIKNCIMHHLLNNAGSWTSQHAWGEGASSGAYLYAENSIFISDGTSSQSAGFSTHNNQLFDLPMVHEFKNCKFVSEKSGCAFRCEGQVSGTEDRCTLWGCEFVGNIYNVNSQSIKITCIGCNLVPTNATTYFSDNSVAYVPENVKSMFNDTGSTITAGSIVAFDGLSKMKLANSSDTVAGFVNADVADGSFGEVIRIGYYRKVDGATFGRRYTVNNGALQLNDNGTVGFCVGNGFILVKGALQ